MLVLVTPPPRNQVGVTDADRFELCGEACLASALGLDVEPIVVWLRQHEGGERAVHNGTGTQVLIDYCRSRGISARVVRGPAVQYVMAAAGRGHYALVLIWSDHQGNPVTRNQSAKLHVGGIGHWLLGYGTAEPQVDVMQPWGGRIVSYDLGHGQDQQLGIEIDRDVRSRPSPSPSPPTPPAPKTVPVSPKAPPGQPPTHVYVVKAGDTLSAIAQREHVTLARLLAANPGIKNKNLIVPGQRIVVPN
jgi:LysM repeat protein